MKHQPVLRWIIPLIGVLALIAAVAGLFWPVIGQPYPVVSLRGESVMIHGSGLYYYDTVSAAVQQQAQDVVTLVLALPVLAIATMLAFRGSLRGQLLLTGTFGYFLYTYSSMSFLTAYNPLFLVYIALFGFSLYGLILSMMSFDLATLPYAFSDRLPRSLIAGVLLALGSFLLIAWLGRIVPPLLKNQPPFGLETMTTLVIQAIDLGVIVPLAFVSGVLLLRRSAWGYLLASVAVLKFLTFGVAVSAMGVNLALSGIPVSPIELGVFPTLTILNAVMAALLLKNVEAPRKALA